MSGFEVPSAATSSTSTTHSVSVEVAEAYTVADTGPASVVRRVNGAVVYEVAVGGVWVVRSSLAQGAFTPADADGIERAPIDH